MDSANEILNWRLMGEGDEVTHVIDNQPGQVLRVVKILALNVEA